VWDIAQLMSFYGNNDELHMAFNFMFAIADFDEPSLRSIVEESYGALPEGAAPVWFGSNHDARRFPTRWCGGDDRKTRCALLALLALQGACFLYFGDEIGMPDTAITKDDLKDPVGLRFWPDEPGRDPGRTPMQWTSDEGAGFTDAGVKPWLPFGDIASYNVAAQMEDPDSMLHLCRDLIALRKGSEDLRSAPYEGLESPPGIWAWRRGGYSVVINMTDVDARYETEAATVVIGTTRERDGTPVDGPVELRPWDGVILR
jgi:alpha-glucosidase